MDATTARLEELLAARGVPLREGPGSGPPRLGDGEHARAAWETFCQAAHESVDGHGDDPHDDMLLFDASWGRAMPRGGLGWGPTGDEPIVYRIGASRTFSSYTRRGDLKNRWALMLRIECEGDPDSIGGVELFGYGGPTRPEVSDTEDPEIRNWAGSVDTWSAVVEASGAMRAFDTLSPNHFLIYTELP